MVQTFSVSTDPIAPRDRFAFWQETVSRTLTGMTIDCPSADRQNFVAELSGTRFAGAALTQIQRSKHLTHRSAQDIRRQPSENMLICCVPASNSAWFQSHGHDDFVAAPGSLVFGYSDVPFSTAPIGVESFRHRFVSLPIALVGPFRRERRVIRGLAIPTDKGIGALLLAQIVALSHTLEGLPVEAMDIALRGLAQLAALAQGLIGPQREGSREAVAAGRITAAERLMARHMRRSDLSPEALAGMLGISARSLHALFEPTGQTFSQRLRALRLAEARRRLAAEPTTPVIDVALDSGFDNLATFYRLFKTEFGMTATEYRRQAMERARSESDLRSK